MIFYYFRDNDFIIRVKVYYYFIWLYKDKSFYYVNKLNTKQIVKAVSEGKEQAASSCLSNTVQSVNNVSELLQQAIDNVS